MRRADVLSSPRGPTTHVQPSSHRQDFSARTLRYQHPTTSPHTDRHRHNNEQNNRGRHRHGLPIIQASNERK